MMVAPRAADDSNRCEGAVVACVQAVVALVFGCHGESVT